jgi:hypothetical protein
MDGNSDSDYFIDNGLEVKDKRKEEKKRKDTNIMIKKERRRRHSRSN